MKGKGFRIAVAALAVLVAAGVLLLFVLPEGESRPAIPPEVVEPWREGIQHLKDGRFEAAEQSLRKVLEATTQPAVRYYFACAIAGQPRREGEAIRELETALKDGFNQETTRGRAERLIGSLHFRTGDLAMAEKHLTSARERLGADPEVEESLRQIARIRKLRESAMGALGDPAGELGRLQALVLLDRAAEAIPALEQIASKDPKNALAWRTLGFARVRLGGKENLEAALKDFDRADACAPGSPRNHLFHGGVLDALGRHDEAVEAFDRGIAAHPYGGDAALFIARGFARVHQGRALEARNDFALACRAAPGSALAQEWLVKTDRAVRDAAYKLRDTGWVPFDESPASVSRRKEVGERLLRELGDEPPAKP